MNKIINLLIIAFVIFSLTANSQTIKGKITSKNEVVPFANIIIEGTKLGVSTDENGSYIIENAPLGHHHIIVSAVGMITKKSYNVVNKGINNINIMLVASVYIWIKL